jgi:hypothetical protein
VAVRCAVRPCLALATSTGRTLVGTGEHPVFDPGERRYRELRSWLTGAAAEVLTDRRDTERVVSCRALAGLRRVWDLTVDSPFHNFVANGLVVHNKSPSFDATLPGSIQDYLDVREAVTMAPATPTVPPTAFTSTGLPITLETDPAVVGPGIVRVTAAQPFDAVVIEAQAPAGHLDGWLEQALPSPATTVDLRITLKGGLTSVVLTLGARVGNVVGPAAFTDFPPP